MNIAMIFAGAVGIGLLGGGAMVAWDRWDTPANEAPGKPSRNSDANPIAPGLAGMLECAGPNTTLRTCAGLSTYSGNTDVGYVSTMSFYGGPSPGGPVTLQITGPVRIKDGMICGTLERQMVMRADIFIAGRQIPTIPEALNRLAGVLEPRLGREYCGRYVRDADGIIGRFYREGEELPEMAVPILWVRPEDGYSVVG